MENAGSKCWKRYYDWPLGNDGTIYHNTISDFYRYRIPSELLDELTRRTGQKSLETKRASGTEILDELAEHEIATGI